MSVESELADLAEVVRDQVAQGIARDLAIKLLAGLVSEMAGAEQVREIVHGHLAAIRRLEAEGDADAEINDKIADHFHDLLLTPANGDAG